MARIGRFIEGMDCAAFLQDDKTQSAVVRELIVIGEAASQVSATFRDEHSGVPWKRLIRVRHFYVHGYRRLDFTEVWRAAARLVGQLPQAIESLLPSGAEGDAPPASA